MARYWFKPRGYGYGAAPVTWEGWVLTAAVTATVVGSIAAMSLLGDRSNFAAWTTWAAIIAVVVFWFARISRRRTDGRVGLALECVVAETDPLVKLVKG